MFNLQSLRQRFRRDASAEVPSPALDDLLAPGRLVIMSAACCDATCAPRDAEMAENLALALRQADSGASVTVATLTDTQRQLKALGADAVGAVAQLRDQLGGVFRAHGLAAFPLLLVDGRVAFYGGIPSVDAIVARLAGEAPAGP